jgi:metal-dependent hydrolase (beta-lactamase superfamily II)
MRARIITLSENTSGMMPGLLAEHGLSVYLEAGGTRLLFDTGQSITAAHNAGMINTIECARKITDQDRIFGVVGGTHLGFGGVRREKLARTVKALKGYDPKLLAVSHCTGLLAACELAEEFKDKFLFSNAGTVIEI